MVCGCSAFRRFCNISGDILPQNQCTHAEQLVVEILYTIADDQMTLLRSFFVRPPENTSYFYFWSVEPDDIKS